MATVLSTTEAELIGFQSQLCRVSHQSAPRCVSPSPYPLVLFLLYRSPPPLPISSLPSFKTRGARARVFHRESRQSRALETLFTNESDPTDPPALVAFGYFRPRAQTSTFSTRFNFRFQPRFESLSLSLSPRALKALRPKEGSRSTVGGLLRDHRSRTDGRINEPRRNGRSLDACVGKRLEIRIQRTAIPS